MPLQGQALKTVALPQADKHPLEMCGLHRGRGGVEAEAEAVWSQYRHRVCIVHFTRIVKCPSPYPSSSLRPP
jgi:hypothetical protein